VTIPRAVLLVLLAAAALAPATAQAGSYRVVACSYGGVQWGNASWVGSTLGNLLVDPECTTGTLIGMRVDGGKRVAGGAARTLTFTSPPGTAITDFWLDRYLQFNSNPPLEGTRPLYALYRLGSTVFAGAGHYHSPTRDRLRAFNAWYGYPENDATLTRRTTTLRQMGALAGYANDARTLQIEVGCYDRTAPCSAPAAGRVYHVLYGIGVTVNDPQPPVPNVTAEGLLAGGPRPGSDPVVLSASDNAGIRRVELIDVTGTPRVVGAYAPTCNPRLPKPCPDLGRTAVVPTSLEAGQRRLLVRTIDAGGNAADRGPYPVNVATPSDRGAINGAGVVEPVQLTARFPKTGGTKRTVRYGRLVRVTGQLVGAQGGPIAGAQLELSTRNRRPGAHNRLRTTTTTAADGTYAFTTRGKASRTLTVGWKARRNDPAPAATAALVLRTHAAASLRVSTRRPAVGSRLVLRGRLRAPARGVTVILQGRRPGSRRFTTFADTTTGRRGRYAVGYRFQSAASRGQRFTFRAKLKPSRRYPFETGYSRRVNVRVR
jgi:hypothetical protein